jgi:hypothetical protein
VGELWEQSKSALVESNILLASIRIILSKAMPKVPSLSWTFITMATIVAGRIAWLAFLIRFADRFPSAEGRCFVFILGTKLISTGFAMINVLTYPHLGSLPLAMLGVCQAGISAASVVSMATSALTYAVHIAQHRFLRSHSGCAAPPVSSLVKIK